jgi:hypothetical protein
MEHKKSEDKDRPKILAIEVMTMTRLKRLTTCMGLMSLALALAPKGSAQALSIDLTQAPPAPQSGYFEMGTATNPQGQSITVNSQYLMRDGKPWLPVMGEFHYARYPQAEWREELLKMKAGGVEVVSTYVFWIYHEEVEGQWDWTGRRDLRKFVQTCGEVGMPVVVRLGPWCHGEVRNGGFPDWLVAKPGIKLRSDNPEYLTYVKPLYAQIAAQLKGLLWKDGGPVIGCQVENEYRGRAEHLLTLKKIAREAGLDVPLYTRTGWPGLGTPMPAGKILPLGGGYAEGFWDRELTPMPGKYWKEFVFASVRATGMIGNEQLGKQQAGREADFNVHPYLTCEIGGGMPSSYHRRMALTPMDLLAAVMVKIGSGGNLAGYYMYHGGTNPDGKLSPLNENQATKMTNYNDLPVKSYEFQGPLGEFGQINPQYAMFRRLHLFLRDFGGLLAPMAAYIPSPAPKDKTDAETLRWAVRSDGKSGFIFINNYQRMLDMPEKKDVQIELKLAGGAMASPVLPSIPANSSFFWPFNMSLGNGVTLVGASAQPACKLDDKESTTYIFAQTPGVASEFVLKGATVESTTGQASTTESGVVRVSEVKPATTSPAINLKSDSGKKIEIFLLSDADSLTLWKEKLAGKERLFLTRAGLVVDDDALRLTASDPKDLSVAILPAPKSLKIDGKKIEGTADGLFTRYTVAATQVKPVAAKVEQARQAGPARAIPFGIAKVASEPTDADFKQAAAWTIKLPAGTDPSRDLLLRIHYVGDVARIKLGDKLLTDNFYNGKPFEVGLRRFGKDVYKKGLTLEILPLSKGAPIMLPPGVKPDFGGKGSVLNLTGVDVVESQTVSLKAK